MPQYGLIRHQHVSQYPSFTINHQPQLITHPMPPVQQQIHPANITQQSVSTIHHSLVNQQSHSQQIGHQATHMPTNLPSKQQQQLSTAAQQPQDEHTQEPLKLRNQSINQPSSTTSTRDLSIKTYKPTSNIYDCKPTIQSATTTISQANSFAK